MVILQKFSSAVLRSLRVVSAILGVVIGNIALNTLSSQHPIWIWLPLALLSIFLLVFPLLIKRELNNRPLGNDSLLLNKFTLVWAWHIWLLF